MGDGPLTRLAKLVRERQENNNGKFMSDCEIIALMTPEERKIMINSPEFQAGLQKGVEILRRFG